MVNKRESVVAPIFSQPNADVVHNVPANAFGENVARATSDFGQSVKNLGELAQAIERQKIANSIQKLNQNLENYTADLISSLNNGSKTFKNHDDFLNNYMSFEKKTGTQLLGNDGFTKWSSSKGVETNTHNSIRLLNAYTLFQNKKNIEDIENFSRDSANAALSAGENLAGGILKKQADFIANSDLPVPDKIKLNNNLFRQYQVALVEKNILNSPQTTIKDLQNNDKKYDYLTPYEHVRYINECERMIGASKGTVKNDSIRVLFNLFSALNEQNPEQANNMLETASKKPNEFIENIKKQMNAMGLDFNGIDHYDLNKFVNLAQSYVNDADQPNAFANAMQFGELETKFNSYFTDEDGKITNEIQDKKNNNVDFVVGLYNTLVGARNNGTLRSYNKQLNEMIFKTNNVLANMMDDAKSANSDTVSEFVIDRIKKMNSPNERVKIKNVNLTNDLGREVQNVSGKGFAVGQRNKFFADTRQEAYVVDNLEALPKEYMAKIYVDVFNQLTKKNVVPSNVINDATDMTEIAKIVDDRFKQYLMLYYNLPSGNFDAVVAGNVLLDYSLGKQNIIKLKGRSDE